MPQGLDYAALQFRAMAMFAFLGDVKKVQRMLQKQIRAVAITLLSMNAHCLIHTHSAFFGSEAQNKCRTVQAMGTIADIYAQIRVHFIAELVTPSVVFVLGGPGAGKGTQWFVSVPEHMFPEVSRNTFKLFYECSRNTVWNTSLELEHAQSV